MNKADFLSRNQLPFRELNIKEFGKVYVKGWNADWQTWYEANTKSTQRRFLVAVALAACDEKGERLFAKSNDKGQPSFDNDDLAEIAKLPQGALMAMVIAIGEMNRFTLEDLEETKKN